MHIHTYNNGMALYQRQDSSIIAIDTSSKRNIDDVNILGITTVALKHIVSLQQFFSRSFIMVSKQKSDGTHSAIISGKLLGGGKWPFSCKICCFQKRNDNIQDQQLTSNIEQLNDYIRQEFYSQAKELYTLINTHSRVTEQQIKEVSNILNQHIDQKKDLVKASCQKKQISNATAQVELLHNFAEIFDVQEQVNRTINELQETVLELIKRQLNQQTTENLTENILWGYEVVKNNLLDLGNLVRENIIMTIQRHCKNAKILLLAKHVHTLFGIDLVNEWFQCPVPVQGWQKITVAMLILHFQQYIEVFYRDVLLNLSNHNIKEVDQLLDQGAVLKQYYDEEEYLKLTLEKLQDEQYKTIQSIKKDWERKISLMASYIEKENIEKIIEELLEFASTELDWLITNAWFCENLSSILSFLLGYAKKECKQGNFKIVDRIKNALFFLKTNIKKGVFIDEYYNQLIVFTTQQFDERNRQIEIQKHHYESGLEAIKQCQFDIVVTACKQLDNFIMQKYDCVEEYRDNLIRFLINQLQNMLDSFQLSCENRDFETSQQWYNETFFQAKRSLLPYFETNERILFQMQTVEKLFCTLQDKIKRQLQKRERRIDVNLKNQNFEAISKDIAELEKYEKQQFKIATEILKHVLKKTKDYLLDIEQKIIDNLSCNNMGKVVKLFYVLKDGDQNGLLFKCELAYLMKKILNDIEKKVEELSVKSEQEIQTFACNAFKIPSCLLLNFQAMDALIKVRVLEEDVNIRQAIEQLSKCVAYSINHIIKVSGEAGFTLAFDLIKIKILCNKMKPLEEFSEINETECIETIIQKYRQQPPDFFYYIGKILFKQKQERQLSNFIDEIMHHYPQFSPINSTEISHIDWSILSPSEQYSSFDICHMQSITHLRALQNKMFESILSIEREPEEAVEKFLHLDNKLLEQIEKHHKHMQDKCIEANNVAFANCLQTNETFSRAMELRTNANTHLAKSKLEILQKESEVLYDRKRKALLLEKMQSKEAIIDSEENE